MALLRLRQSGLPFRAGMRGRTVAHGHAPKSREETRRGLSRTARAATWAPTRPRLQGCHLRSRPWELLATHVIHGFFRCGLYVCLEKLWVSMAVWNILTQVFEESALPVTCDELWQSTNVLIVSSCCGVRFQSAVRLQFGPPLPWVVWPDTNISSAPHNDAHWEYECLPQ